MDGVAVVLAGVPGPIFNRVLGEIRRRYPEGYVVRGRAAKLVDSRRTVYQGAEISRTVEAAADAIFGASKRSFSFCRNPRQACAVTAKGKKTCGRTSDEACRLEAPTRLILLFQEGVLEDELLAAFHYSTLSHKIPAKAYNDEQNTIGFCLNAIEKSSGKLGRIAKALSVGAPPILLPPRAFGRGRAVRKLLNGINACSDPVTESAQFRRSHFLSSENSYVGDNRLGYKRAERTEHHGRAGPTTSASLAITKRFRLGCAYDDTFHWDVTPLDGKDLGGRCALTCREFGGRRPRGDHLNIWPDDWIGPVKTKKK